MKRKRCVLLIALTGFMLLSACNIPSQAEQELMDMGFTSEEAEEIADFAEELESELEEDSEERVSEEATTEYMVTPMEEILNAKLTDLIVQFDDIIIPIDGTLTGQEVMDMMAQTTACENVEWSNLYTTVDANSFGRIEYASDYTEGIIVVYNPTEEGCEPAKCFVFELSAYNVLIPAGGYIGHCTIYYEDAVLEHLLENGCYVEFSSDDYNGFMTGQGFIFEGEKTTMTGEDSYDYSAYTVLHIGNNNIYYQYYRAVLTRDPDTGMYYIKTPYAVNNKIIDINWYYFPEEVIEQDKIEHPEYY